MTTLLAVLVLAVGVWSATVSAATTDTTVSTTTPTTTTTPVIPPPDTRQLVKMREVRGGIRWARRRTWYWQDKARVKRSPEIRGVAKPHSLGYLRWISKRWNQRRVAAYKYAHRRVIRTTYVTTGSVPAVICSVFGAYNCGTAKAIAWRESRYETSASNGTHWGLFQLDSSALSSYATIGYSTAYEQTVAAHNMYEARGWEPWTCCEG